MRDSKNNFLSRWLPLSICIFYLTFSSSAQCPCTDCRCSDSLALVALYDTTNGGNWTNKWQLTQPMTAWYGVTLTNGRVTCIDLDGISSCLSTEGVGNNLVGQIPLKLNNLTQLTSLILNNNKLTGSIPDINLPNLVVFALSSNQLSGNVPNFNLPKLQTLNLYNNQLTGTIPNFNLINLQIVALSKNKLTGTIPNFNLPNLKELLLYENQLSGTIPNFNLPKLQNLFLSINQLTSTIPNFNFPQLQYLSLSNNQLSGTIPNFNFPNLMDLLLDNNQLTGTIPNFDLPNLFRLNLYGNRLSGAIPNFNLPTLTDFNLGINQLTGTIPDFNLPKLINLHLGFNQLTGTIPVFNLPNFKTFFLNQNKLSGCLPSGLRALCAQIRFGSIIDNPNLATQDWTAFCTNGAGECVTCAAPATPSVSSITNTGSTINWLAVTGATSYKVEYKTTASTNWTALAPIIGLTTPLTGLLQGTTYNVRITTNCTSGASTPSVFAAFTTLGRAFPVGLPTCLEDDFRELEKLYDSTNGNNWTDKTGWFSANIATWKGIFLTTDGCDVKTINVPTNNLIGTIPNFNLPKLTALILNGNQLNGSIPNFNLPELQTLILGDNKLTGTIPNFNCPKLQFLSLLNNQLSGAIPNFNFPDLQRLLLNQNQLTGTIPNFNFPFLIDLIVNNNLLNGAIPNFNFSKLEYLNLAQNKLTGTIPNFNFPNLKNLYLTDNQLNGAIPNFNYPNLLNLALGQNQLSGAIPNFNLPNLTLLILFQNQLTGTIPNFNLPVLKNLHLGQNQLSGCLPSGLRNLCSHVTTGDISSNPNLATQSWTAFCANGTGECVICAATTISTQRTDTAICAGKTYTLPNGRIVNTATNFRDTLKNKNGCDSLIRVVNLSINPLPVPDVRDVTICPNETATLQIRNTPNNYRIFQWQNNTSTTATANYTPSVSDTYKVTVTDINGCQGIATANITVKSASDTSCITVIPKPKAVNDNVTLELNQTKLNFNVTTNDIFDRNLNWKVSVQEQPVQGILNDLDKGAFLYEATPNQRGVVTFKYRLCTTWRSVDYCDSATVTINVLGRDRKLPPDAITPNGDGKNDSFIIPDLEENPTKYPNNELLILNRWGQVLYQAKPYKNDWEGTNQQNQPLPDGTYYYIMRLSIADGKILTGDLLIVRD